jgi:hypothetical protein
MMSSGLRGLSIFGEVGGLVMVEAMQSVTLGLGFGIG